MTPHEPTPAGTAPHPAPATAAPITSTASASSPPSADTQTLFYNLTLPSLTQWLTARGQPAYRATQIMRWVYQRRTFTWDQMSDLPRPLRAELHAAFSLTLPTILRTQGSADSTRKFLLAMPGGAAVETVLIPASPALYGRPSDRLTLCVSTQVGCAYGCRFCASGLLGWKRNLSPGEIVSQLLAAEAATSARVNNIVFMGMGEPLANFDSLLTAIDILNAPWGPHIGARHITVSTSGLVPQIRQLAAQPLQIRLAISLHGATDQVRSQIMPINRKYPLAELLQACHDYARAKKQRITFEYILIAGVNDSPQDALHLARIARPLRAKINLIPYNTVEGLPWQRPSEAAQEHFIQTLRKAGASATLRREKGHDIQAACGQLRLQTINAQPPAI